MSQILLKWLKSLSWSPESGGPPTASDYSDLEHSFANGYFLGSLLATIGYQDNFNTNYIKGDTADILIKNYTCLESTLRRKLSIHLSSTTALNLIHAKPGVVSKLLYEIKTQSDSLPINPLALKKRLKSMDQSQSQIKKHEKFDSYPASPDHEKTVDPLKNIEEFHQEILPFDAQAIQHFGIVLKQKLKRTNEYIPKKLPSLPKKKELPPIPKKSIVKNIEPEVKAPPKSPIRKNFKLSATIIQQDSDSDGDDPVPTPSALKAAAPLIASISFTETKSTANIEFLQSSFEDDDFEANQDPTAVSDATIADFLKQRASLDSSKHLRQLRVALESSDALDPGETRLYLEKIKIQRHEVQIARKEREQRHKKTFIAKQKIEADMEKQILDYIMATKLLRQSKQERRIAEQLLQIRHEKEVMLENRIYREEQYAAARKIEYEEALAREHELYANSQKEYRDQVGMQIQQHVEIIRAKKVLQHEKDTEWIRTKIVCEIVNLVMECIQYKVLNDKKEVPAKKLRDWKLMMFNDLSIPDYQEIPLEKNRITTIASANSAPESSEQKEIPEPIKVLDTVEFEEYLNYSGSWETSAETPIKNNDSLAALLENLIISTKQPVEKYPVIPVPVVPLRIAVIGKRNSGKTSVAKFIAKRYKMSILDFDDIVKDAVAQADTGVKGKRGGANDPKENKKGALSKQQIGAKIQACMLEGTTPDDSYLVQLVVEAMSVEPESSGGWLLVDFPRTKQQAQMLEREISGYEDPKPAKKGEMKRLNNPPTKDLERGAGNKISGGFRIRSLIASSETPADNLVAMPVSGFDAIVLLDITNEAAIKRATGQSIDPVTGQSYHIEFKPPPTNIPGTMERLAQVEDPSRAMQQLHFQLASFEEEEEGLKEWIGQFKSLKVVKAVQPLKTVEKEVETSLDEVITAVNKGHLLMDCKPGSAGEAKIELKAPSEEDVNNNIRGSVIFPNIPAEWQRSETNQSTTARTNESDGSTSELALRKVRVISREMGQILTDQWILIEMGYTETLKFTFRSLRKLLQDAVVYFYQTKIKFQDYLRRPDTEQELVEVFLKEYNALEEDFRIDSDVKAELHQRVEELREKLWEVADRRREEAEGERIAIIEDRWIEDHSYILANLLVTMIQAEADRYFGTRQFIIDYFKEFNGVPVTENGKPPVKIPFISNTAPPPIEVGSALIAASEAAALHRKDQIFTKAPEPSHGKKEKGNVEAKAEKIPAKDKAASKPSNDKNSKQADSKTAAAAPVVELTPTDPDQLAFPDIWSTVDYLYGILASPDYALDSALIENSQAATLKDKKVANDQKDDNEKHIPADAFKYLEIEEKMLRQRVDRIKQRVTDIFKDFRGRSLEVYGLLDEWIGRRYKIEIEVAKDLTTLIKEAIEAEQQLPNQILLEGDKLFLDYSTLVLEPEPEPRPGSPVEKSQSDQFSIKQLRILCNNLKQLGPNGVIATRLLNEYFVKASMFAGPQDGLPESFVGVEASTLTHFINSLDPFDTGYVSWRKFWMISSRLLPIDYAQLVELKLQFDGEKHISHEKFDSLTFWFEKTQKAAPASFDRPAKIKQVLFDVFNSPEHGFDVIDFLFTCCCDEIPEVALEKAFAVVADNSQLSQSKPIALHKERIHCIFTHFLYLTKSTHRIDTAKDSETPYPEQVLNKIFSSCGGTDERPVTWGQFVDGCSKSNHEDWLDCPLYPIDDLGASSRPNSAKHQRATTTSR